MSFLDTPIEQLYGVGKQTATLLQRELGVFTYGDMLNLFPLRHVDRSNVVTVSQINANSKHVVLRGNICHIETVGTGRTAHLSAKFIDRTGSIDLVWFKGYKWVKESLRENVEYIIFGHPTLFNRRFNMAHPEIETVASASQRPKEPFTPIYSMPEKLKTRGVNQKTLTKIIRQILFMSKGYIEETLPESVVRHYNLLSREEALNLIHFPQQSIDITRASDRIKFEELFFLQLDYQYAREMRKLTVEGRVFSTVGEHFNQFYNNNLKFELTDAQKRVVKEIRADMRSGHQMNRLLQGDVGSGKTLVALLCMLIASDNNCQSCLMAPTEILATQHFNNISQMLAGIDINVELLTGSTRASKRKVLKQQLLNGEIDILIGTHALIEDDVQFAQLGFVVIDEQHRFGVEQRSRLWNKSSTPPHILVMTATPIPRTLAMTLYGDLDCSVIDQLPPGRKPIITRHCTDLQRPAVFNFLRSEIDKGRQVYVVYPLINESEKSDLKDLMDGYDMIARDFPIPDYQMTILHGRMTAEDKEYSMERFKSGVANIMVCTTVIEVGVDVPNATVMMIENAERFGLAQLHQLRGRVGRGGEQSYCILMTNDELSYTSKQRIRTMVESNDGFRIAEADLKLRGPGDLQGLQQSGVLQLKLANIIADEPIVKASRETVAAILQRDPQLEDPRWATMRRYVEDNSKTNWSKIS